MDPDAIENVRSRRPNAAISDHLPYEADFLCRVFVRIHPNGATLEEVGAMFDVTRERIRQIEANAIRKIKHFCDAEGLDFDDFILDLNIEHSSATESLYGIV